MALLPGRLVVDSNILTGKPVVRGTRISVELVVDPIAARQHNAHCALPNFRLIGVPGASFVSRTGEHRKARILWEARIACGKVAKIEDRTTVRANDLDVGTSGTQSYRRVDVAPPFR
jgi:hypothetical protein